jgi:serine/threonine-protein kinase
MGLPAGFRVVRKLGQGSMGEVYLATHDRAPGRRCAVKLIRGDRRNEPAAAKRFRAEMTAIAALRHPHIVRLLGRGHLAGRREFFAMEYVDGLTLEELVDRRGPLSARTVVDVLLQICSALSAVHAQGYVHRDVKPANIIAVEHPDGSLIAKLVDFGLVASPEPPATDPGETIMSGFVGSPLYAPPESALGLMDARSDIYSLGATAYHLLVGRPVFDVRDPIRAVYAHAVEAPLAAEALRDDVGPLLNGIIMKCLEKHPDDRFQSMDELAAALSVVHKSLSRECAA